MTRKQYNQCVDDHADAIYGFALKNLRQEDDARDIVQESFEKLWRRHEAVEYEKSRSYLFSIAYHCIIDQVRKVKRFSAADVTGDLLEERPHGYEDRQWIEAGLDKLNEQERSLIILRDYEGYSYEELSGLTGLSLTQVKVYLFRARKKFKDWLVQINRINHVI